MPNADESKYKLNTPDYSDRPAITIVADRFAVIITLKPDDDQHDWEQDESWWEIIHHHRRLSQGYDPERFREIMEQVQAGDSDAQVLSCYEHGQFLWWPVDDRRTGARVPDMQWDGCHAAGLMIPGKEMLAHMDEQRMGEVERATYLHEQAKGAAKTWTTWLNNDYYGYTLKVYDVLRDEDTGEIVDDPDEYDSNGEEADQGSCWGYDDSNYAKECAVDEATAMLDALLAEPKAVNDDPAQLPLLG
jgi:hypothetical protein